jgi:iron complex outermembrane receptor protein
MKKLICLIAAAGWASLAVAQTLVALSEKDFLDDMPVVLSVSRLPQRLDDAPGAVTIMDRNMIRLSGARDVADLMRLVPGFQTSTSFEADAPQASYHGGFGGYSSRMQVLVDGRSVYSPYFIGSIAPGLQTVALEDIDHIEVLRGSNSAAYGARAFLGVINIVTRDPVDTLGVQASLTGGENDVRDGRASFGWSAGDTALRFGVDRRADAGLTGGHGRNQVNRVNFRADWRPNARDEVEVRSGLLEIRTGKGFPELLEQRDTGLDIGYLQLDWRRNLGLDSDLALSVSRSQESYADKIDFFDLDFGGTSSSDTFSLTHTFRQGPDVRVVWGGEFRREALVSKTFYNTDAALVTDFTRLFGNAEWRFARNLVLNAGGLAEHSSVNGDSLAPRLMLNWHFAEGQTLRMGVSRAFRPPSTFEKSADLYVQGFSFIKATGHAQPETIRAREIGYLGDFPALAMNLDVRAFSERIGGFIRQENDIVGVPRDYFNNEDFSIQGIEYQLKWRPWPGGQLIFNQTYTEIGTRDEGNALAAPKLASSLVFFQKLPGGLDLSLMHQDNSAETLQGAAKAAAMTRTDLRLGLPLRFGAQKGEVALVVQNLGRPYQDFDPGFEFQRRAFVTLRLDN